MTQQIRNALYVVVGIALTLGVVFSIGAAKAKPELAAAADAPAHYTVVNTDGAHLIVVDNTTSKLYFYAIDKEGKVGDELKLRGSADLTNVGKPSIKPIDAKVQK